MSPTDRVRDFGGKVASGAKNGASKGLEGIVRPDPKYSFGIDMHRRASYVLSGMPFYAVVEHFGGMSDIESLKARGLDFAGSMLISGLILRGRERTQAGFSSEIGNKYTAAGRLLVDACFFGVTSSVLAMGFYFGLDTLNNVGDALIHNDTRFTYDWERIGKSAAFNGIINVAASPLRGTIPDIINLSYGREPAGRLPQFMKGLEAKTYGTMQKVAGIGILGATVAAYVGL